MEYSLACGDVVPGCAVTFQDHDQNGLLGQVAAHAGRDHPGIELTPAVQAAVTAAIRAG